mgnify:CR=1 FL=1
MDRVVPAALPYICNAAAGALRRFCKMTANSVQKTGIRKTVTILATFAVAVFVWSIVKYLL